jgi:DNA-binding NarL/FixJ family response regulator
VSIRLLLAEDHRIVRERLRMLLQDREGWQVVAEASDGGEAVRLAEAHRPDVAVIGLAMPVLSGMETTRRIVARSPVTKVIVLSTHADDAYVDEARLAGAHGFVLTDAADVDLPAAVDEVSQGRSFTSRTGAKIAPPAGPLRFGGGDRGT